VYWARIRIKVNLMGAEISMILGNPGGKGAGSTHNSARLA